LESRLLGDRRILGASPLAPAMFAREADKKRVFARVAASLFDAEPLLRKPN
jgi:hypothetical protein